MYRSNYENADLRKEIALNHFVAAQRHFTNSVYSNAILECSRALGYGRILGDTLWRIFYLKAEAELMWAKELKSNNQNQKAMEVINSAADDIKETIKLFLEGNSSIENAQFAEAFFLLQAEIYCFRVNEYGALNQLEEQRNCLAHAIFAYDNASRLTPNFSKRTVYQGKMVELGQQLEQVVQRCAQLPPLRLPNTHDSSQHPLEQQRIPFAQRVTTIPHPVFARPTAERAQSQFSLAGKVNPVDAQFLHMSNVQGVTLPLAPPLRQGDPNDEDDSDSEAARSLLSLRRTATS